MSSAAKKLDPHLRAAEKARARADDEQAMQSGEKTPAQVQAANSRIVLRNARMILSKSERLS